MRAHLCLAIMANSSYGSVRLVQCVCSAAHLSSTQMQSPGATAGAASPSAWTNRRLAANLPQQGKGRPGAVMCCCQLVHAGQSGTAVSWCMLGSQALLSVGASWRRAVAAQHFQGRRRHIDDLVDVPHKCYNFVVHAMNVAVTFHPTNEVAAEAAQHVTRSAMARRHTCAPQQARSHARRVEHPAAHSPGQPACIAGQ